MKNLTFGQEILRFAQNDIIVSKRKSCGLALCSIPGTANKAGVMLNGAQRREEFRLRIRDASNAQHDIIISKRKPWSS